MAFERRCRLTKAGKTDSLLESASRAWAMAAIGSGSWDEAIAATGEGVRARMGLMFSPGESWRARQINGFLGAPREVTAEYAAHWIQRDVWIKASSADPEFQFAGSVKAGSDVLTEKALLRTDFYNDFCRRWGGHDIVSLHVCDTRDPIAMPAYLSFYRSKEEGMFGDAAKRFLQDLWPHVQRSIHAYWRLERAKAAEVAEPDLLSPIPSAIFVAREDGMVDYANPAAIAVLRDFAGRGAGQRVLAALPGMTQAELRSALQQCSRGLSYGRTTTAFRRDGSATRLNFSFVPIAGDPAYSLQWPHSCALISIDRVDAAQAVEQQLQAFCVGNALTRKEATVLAMLVKGIDVPTIADSLGLGYATARTHVASILAKTNSARQTELLAKVLGSG